MECINIENVWVTEGEFQKILFEELGKVGVLSFATKKSVGTKNMGVAGFSSSGDLALFAGSFDDEEETLNPFSARLKHNSWIEAIISLKEVARYHKAVNGIAFEGRTIRVEKNNNIRNGFSSLGCLIGGIIFIPTIFLGLIFDIVGIFIGALFVYITYSIVKAISRLLVRGKHGERNLLDKRIAYALENLPKRLAETRPF